MTSIKPRDVTEKKPTCKMVTFHPNVRVFPLEEDGYDRRSTPYYNLTSEDIAYLIAIRRLMLAHQYISDNPAVPQEPLPAREVYFNRYLEAWRRREKKANAPFLPEKPTVERRIQFSPYV